MEARVSVGLCDSGQERGVQMLRVAFKASSFPFPWQAVPRTPPAAAHPDPHVPRHMPRSGRELFPGGQPWISQ